MNIEKIKPSGIFTNYIYKCIPLAFDESMSYYETLCAILNRLYDDEKVVNHNADLLAELEEYVNHYFDNLDVQEMIDEKLDKMVIDGTLADIINQEIFGELSGKVTQLENKTANITTDEANIQKLLKFNEYTNKPLRYGELSLPSDFNGINFKLYRANDGSIYDDLNLSSFDSNNVVYVDYDNGDDTTHEDGIFKTVKGALTYVNSLTGNVYKIKCKTYRFSRNEFYNEQDGTADFTMNKSIIIEPYDPEKRIVVSTDQRNLEWTQTNGLWTTTRAGVTGMYNINKPNGFGMYTPLTQVESLADCQATVESYYLSGSDVYVHTEGNLQPNYDRYILRLGLTIIRFDLNGNHFLRLKNIDFYPSGRINFHNSGSSYENTVILENVHLYGSNDNNGIGIADIKTAYVLECITGANRRDGFNYHYANTPSNVIPNLIAYERNCISFNNGINDENSNNNCSTIHEGGRIIRVNGVYQNSKSIAIADIGSSKTMMINCEVNQFTNNYHAYRFDDEVEGSGLGRAYLIDCTALQKRTLSIEGTEDFNVQVKNFHGNYENSDLNISLYEE